MADPRGQQRQPFPTWFWVLGFVLPVAPMLRSSWDLSEWTGWSWTLLVIYILWMAFTAAMVSRSLRRRVNV